MLMKNLFVLCLFLNIFLFASYGQTGEYRLVWQDTFDGDKLDETVWKIEVNGDGGGNNELQYYRKENISVGVEPASGENCLILTAKKENYGSKVCTSGRLNTMGKMRFKYGKIEGRIKLPKTANGLWPAFWMMGDDYPNSGVGWPKCGEIDILEMGNTTGINRGTQERYFGGHFHWGESWNGGSYPNWGKAMDAPYSLQDDFHLWTLVWDSNSVKMYLDLDKYPNNTPYLEMAINNGTDPGQAGRYFNKPFFVILNLAIGGNFTGITGNANIAKITAFDKASDGEPKMYIDYIKVYQKGDAGEEYNGPELLSIEETPPVDQQFKVFCKAGALSVEGEAEPAKMVLYSLDGLKMLEVKKSNSVNVSNLPSGIYILKIQTVSGCEEIHKVINNE